MKEDEPDTETLPVFYLAELLNILAGLEDTNDYSLHAVDPAPLLTKLGRASGVSKP